MEIERVIPSRSFDFIIHKWRSYTQVKTAVCRVLKLIKPSIVEWPETFWVGTLFEKVSLAS